MSYEDGTADLLIFGENDKKEYFSLFCKAYNYLSPSIRAFGEDVETALEIIDNVLEWVESTKQEEMNNQVLKANFLLDLLMKKKVIHYLEDERIEYNYEAQKHLDLEDRENPQRMLVIYNQMLTEVTDEELQEIIKVSFDHEKKYDLFYNF